MDMKNTMRYLLPTLLLLGASGCSKEGPEWPGARTREIRIASSIDAVGRTRAAQKPASALLGAKFLQVNATSMPAGMAGATLFTGDRAGDATGAITFTGSPVPLYSIGNDNAYIVGYWPGSGAGVTITEGTSVAWTIDGKTDILLTPVWDAGKYAAPNTGATGTTMTFEHRLAQLEVICKAEAGRELSVVQAAWGAITSIELVGTLPGAKYTYAANAMTFTGTAADMKLLKNDYETAFTQTAVPANGNTAVTAAGMFAPSTGVFQLLVKTVEVPEGIRINVQLQAGGANKDFEIGKKHTVTLTFEPNPKNIVITGTSIAAWTDGYTSGSDEKI